MMKKTLFLMALVASSLSLEAQDILVRKGGEVESVKVLEVSPTEVKYKKSNNLDGPIFIEKRSNIYSVKYQNGDVQTLNEKPEKTKKQLSVSSPYNKVKNFNHEFDLHLGNGWGLGYQLRKEFNPYIGWDIIGISYMSRFQSPGNVGLINFRPLGIKLFTPACQAIRGYAGLNLGYSFGYERYHYINIYYDDTWEYTDKYTSYYKDHFFGLDFSVGIQFHKNFAIGYNLNFITNSDNRLISHMAKLSYIF